MFRGALFIAFILCVVFLLGNCQVATETNDLGNKLIYNRVRKSHTAKTEKDLVNVLILAEWKSGIGILEKSSSFHQESDLFIHSRNSDPYLVLTALQTDKKYNLNLRAYTCDINGYDYCLEVYGSPLGPKRYYSSDGMEVDTNQLKFEYNIRWN